MLTFSIVTAREARESNVSAQARGTPPGIHRLHPACGRRTGRHADGRREGDHLGAQTQAECGRGGAWQGPGGLPHSQLRLLLGGGETPSRQAAQGSC